MSELDKLEAYPYILWDFDGVLIDSMPIRDEGFRFALSGYQEEKVEALVQYHRKNGGLSRYHKFEYFLREILDVEFSQDQVNSLADRFSDLMREKMNDRSLLIEEAVETVKKMYDAGRVQFIVSGSDQRELRHLTEVLGIKGYFADILGSPTPKSKLIARLIDQEQIVPSKSCLVGDSTNDRDAALKNQIVFVPYNYFD